MFALVSDVLSIFPDVLFGDLLFTTDVAVAVTVAVAITLIVSIGRVGILLVLLTQILIIGR